MPIPWLIRFSLGAILTSAFLQQWGWALLAAGAGVVFVVRARWQTEEGRRWRDRALLRLPLWGKIGRQLADFVERQLLTESYQGKDKVRVHRLRFPHHLTVLCPDKADISEEEVGLMAT